MALLQEVLYTAMILSLLLCGSIACYYMCKNSNVFTGTNIRIELVGGGAHDGRVEVIKDGVRGTVCNDEWDLTESHVVCKMLGYP